MHSSSSSDKAALRFWQVVLFIVLLAIWHVATSPTLLRRSISITRTRRHFFSASRQGAGAHLGLVSPPARFTPISGDSARDGARFRHRHRARARHGLWLALSPVASALLDPYIKALNSMPRVILAPIFAVWFGLTSPPRSRSA